MSIIVYGIKSCDTMKKAFTWLDEHGIEYAFFDYKKEAISTVKIKEWLTKADVKKLINTKGTTFKKLTPEQQLSINDLAKVIELMQANTSMIKRPLVEHNNEIILGFDVSSWETIFKG